MALKNTLAAAVLFFVLANSACFDKAGAGELASEPAAAPFINRRYPDESYGFAGDLSKHLEKYNIDESIQALDIDGSFSNLSFVERFYNLEKLRRAIASASQIEDPENIKPGTIVEIPPLY